MKYPRSFSSLNKHCAHAGLLKAIPRKNYARDKAADKGNVFHKATELWVKGENPFDAGLTGETYQWFQRLRDIWSPPAGCMAEVAIGLDALGVAHEVDEPEPHCYVSRSGVELVTAGRLDLRWWEGHGLYVVDIKTGQSYLGDPWDVPQLVAQAVAATALARQDSGVLALSSVRLGVYYARLGVFDFAPARSAESVSKLFPAVAEWGLMDTTPRPGGHCLSCWEKKNCATFMEMTEAA
jgi:hypothetical protein